MKQAPEPYRYNSSYPNYTQPKPSPGMLKRKRGRKGLWFGCLLVISAALTGLLYVNGTIGRHSTASASQSGPTAPVASVEPPTDTAGMAAQINAIIAKYPDMEVSVSVVDLKTGQQLQYGVSGAYVAASVAKLLTATLYLHQTESGTRSLNTPVAGQTAEYELQQMIEQSDNDAWEALNALLGHPALEAYATQIELKNYSADTNLLSTADVATLLTQLYNGKLLNQTDTQLLLGYMQQANEAEYIPANVPAGVTVYHKAGYLSDRVHDAAIVDDGHHPYVLVIFTKTVGDYDTSRGAQLFKEITTATTQTFIKS